MGQAWNVHRARSDHTMIGANTRDDLEQSLVIGIDYSMGFPSLEHRGSYDPELRQLVGWSVAGPEDAWVHIFGYLGHLELSRCASVRSFEARFLSLCPALLADVFWNISWVTNTIGG